MEKLFEYITLLSGRHGTPEEYLRFFKYWREVNQDYEVPGVEVFRKIDEYENSPFYQHKRYYWINGKYECLDDV